LLGEQLISQHMSTNPRELFAAATHSGEPLNGRAGRLDRRKRLRTKVHWPIVLFQEHTGETVETVTRNLSSSGFYCLSRVRFACGEVLICSLQIPTHERSGNGETLALECRATVVRSEPAAGDRYCGIACQIEDYKLASGSDSGFRAAEIGQGVTTD
jgi:hypothetical protein